MNDLVGNFIYLIALFSVNSFQPFEVGLKQFQRPFPNIVYFGCSSDLWWWPRPEGLDELSLMCDNGLWKPVHSSLVMNVITMNPIPNQVYID